MKNQRNAVSDTEQVDRPLSMTLRHWLPLVGFVVPTVVIGYGFVIPRSCIAGVNELTIGFATTIIGACVTYVLGVRSALATKGRD
jgi:ABC-type Fe3+ transport system permease subunit